MSQLTDIMTAQTTLEDSFSKRMAELEAQLHTAGPAKETVTKVAEEFRTFKELMFSMLKLLRQQISECSHMIDMVETRHRRKALIFLGVAESEKDDCTASVLKIIHNMGFMDTQASHFRVCHRIGAARQEHYRPILVRFTSLEQRTAVWRAKSRLKGTTSSLREFLTRPRQAVFTKARLHFGMRACWTQDGIIVIKVADGSRHKVTTMDELNSLTRKYAKASGDPAVRSGVDNVGTTGAISKGRK